MLAQPQDIALKFPVTSDCITSIAHWLRSYKLRYRQHANITETQYIILDLLDWMGGSSNVNKLATCLGMQKSTISSALIGLELSGLVMRRQEDTDRRRINVILTNSALDILKHAKNIAEDIMQEELKPLGKYLKAAMLDVAENIVVSHKLDNDKFLKSDMYFYRICLFCEQLFLNCLKSEGLSSLEFRLLFELKDYSRGIGIKELAYRLLAYLSDTTIVCNALASRQLLACSKNSIDRRATIVDITSDGYALLQTVAPKIDSLLMQLAPNLSKYNRQILLKAARLMCANQRRSFLP